MGIVIVLFQEAKVIWQKLHQMTPLNDPHCTRRVTDRRTDTANIGNNSLHLMHSMQPKSRPHAVDAYASARTTLPRGGGCPGVTLE